MNTTRRIAAAVGIAVAALTATAAVASADDRVVPQDQFPCAEDEVLGYAPQFGPDHVGCIHIDDLR